MKNSNNDNFILEFNEDDLDDISILSIGELRSNINKYQTDLLLNYYDMSYVSSIADNCFVLSTPFKLYSHRGFISEEIKNQYENDAIFVNDYNKKAIKIHKKLKKHVNLKSLLFEQIRQIYPDFCLKVEDKMDLDQLNFYRNIRKKLRLSICYDSHYSTDTTCKDILNELRDKLSQIIDSNSFIEACIIEDNFVLSEFNKFSNQLDNIPLNERKSFLSKKISISDNNSFRTQELLEKFSYELSNKLSRHLETLKLYDKISSAKEIRLDIKAEDHSDDSCDR